MRDSIFSATAVNNIVATATRSPSASASNVTRGAVLTMTPPEFGLPLLHSMRNKMWNRPTKTF
jgi:hypothetical protein